MSKREIKTNVIFCLRKDCKTFVGIKDLETLYIKTQKGFLEVPVKDARLLARRLLRALEYLKGG